MITTYTVANYKTWVRGRLPGLTLADALLTDLVSSTNRDVCNAELWPFKEKTFVGSVAQGDRTFDLQATISDFQVPMPLQLIDPNNSAVAVRYMPWQTYLRLYPDPEQLTQTRPWMWSMFGSTLIIGPAPMDKTYTFNLPYIAEPTALTTDSDVVDIPDAFSEVLIVGTKVRSLKAKHKYNEAQVEQQDYDVLFENMKKRLLVRQDGDLVDVGHGRQYTNVPGDPYSYYET